MVNIEKKLDINIHVTRSLARAGKNDTPHNYLVMLYDLQRRWEDERTITAEKQEWLDALYEEIAFYEKLI